MTDASLQQCLSGERFRVDYLITGEEREARARADAVRVEQTVEFPFELLAPGPIPDQVVGQVEAFTRAPDGRWRATISYAVECSGCELLQLLNVVFGNVSLMPGIRVVGLSPPPGLLARFRGPRHGRDGLRALLGVPQRPLFCTALKPMGRDARELADLAYRCALGGVDLVKDDHGLADQVFCPFEERVARCAEAVAKANARTGLSCRYLPNVTGPAPGLVERAHRAKALGAGALVVSPWLVGFDALRALADDDGLGLPLMAHPTFGGSLVTSPENGIAHGVLYGTLLRLAGADLAVFPNFGGRFSFSREECGEIARACAAPLGALRPSLPAPGGGMTAESGPGQLEVYGRDFALLMGGGLHRRSPDVTANARELVELLAGL